MSRFNNKIFPRDKWQVGDVIKRATAHLILSVGHNYIISNIDDDHNFLIIIDLISGVKFSNVFNSMNFDFVERPDIL